MNKTLLIYLFSMISHGLLAAETTAPVEVKPEAIGGVATSESFNKLLKVPGVQEKYDECKAEAKVKVAKGEMDKDKVLSTIPQCLWDKVKDDPKTKDVVEAEYKKTIEVDGKADLTANKTIASSTFSSEKNSGFQKLSQIIGDRLHKTLYGEIKDPSKFISADHSQFHEIYKTELSKTIVDSMTAFCLNTDLSVDISKLKSNDSCLKSKCSTADKKDIDKCMDDSKLSCVEFNYTKPNDKLTEEQDKSSNKSKNLELVNNGTISENVVTACMSSIPSMCEFSSDTTTRQKACVVVENMKAIRKNIALTEKIQDTLNKTAGVNGSNQLQIQNMSPATNGEIDNMKTVTVTSKDVEDAYKDENKKLTALAEECAKNPENAGCETLLSKNKDEKENAVVEFGLRQAAKEAELEKVLDSKDKNQLKDYLKKLGYDDAKIESIMKLEGTEFEGIKKSITNKFKAEKEALIAELAERVKNTTTSVSGKSDEDDKIKYSTIAAELASKSDNLKSLVRFNNIASSYLTIEDKAASRNPSSDTSKDKSRNITSLKEELNANKDDLKNKIVAEQKKEDLNKKNTNNQNVSITIQNLNEILGISF